MKHAQHWSKLCMYVQLVAKFYTLTKAIKEEFKAKSVEHVLDKDILVYNNSEYFLLDLQFDLGQANTMENWLCKEGFVASVKKLRQEYNNKRRVTPLRVCMWGPPASGKTTLAQMLSKHYKVPHLALEQVIASYFAQEEAYNAELKAIMDARKPVQKTDDSDEPAPVNDDDENSPVGILKKKMAEIQQVKAMKDDKQRLKDEALIKVFFWRLTQRDCSNQGWIMDGFPKTIAQMKLLMMGEKTEEDAGDATDKPKANPATFPEFVISLGVKDDKILRDRLLRLPEKLVQGTHNNEEGFKRRLAAYRTNNVDNMDNSLLAFTEEVTTMNNDQAIIKELVCTEMDIPETILPQLIDFLGEPRNYGPSAEEIAEEMKKKKQAEEESKKKQQSQVEQAAMQEEQAKQQREQVRKRDAQRLLDIEQHEKEMLQIKSEPLRQYLMANVIPVLSRGLIEVCRVQPEDPVDYLATWLFKNSAPPASKNDTEE